jgi:hypothetical protein
MWSRCTSGSSLSSTTDVHRRLWTETDSSDSDLSPRRLWTRGSRCRMEGSKWLSSRGVRAKRAVPWRADASLRSLRIHCTPSCLLPLQRNLHCRAHGWTVTTGVLRAEESVLYQQTIWRFLRDDTSLLLTTSPNAARTVRYYAPR